MRLSGTTYRLIDRAALSAILVSAVLTSCERRPLDDPDFNTSINVKVSVEAISNVTCDIYNDKIPVPKIDPDMMHVLFFEETGDALATEAYISTKSTDSDGNTVFSGKLSIAPGTYRMYIYNFGTENTLIRNTYSWENAEAYAANVPDRISRSYQTKVPAEEPITYSPDHLVVARSPREVIPYHSGIYTVKAESRSVVESYYLQIKVDGIEYVSGARAVLSGMSGGNRIALGERMDDQRTSIFFPLVKSDDKGVPVICCIFNTFGRPDDSLNSLEVTFDIVTKAGESVQKTFDISELFRSEDCIKHHWLLLDETIKIDPPKTPDPGGFNPSVDDWENENHDIIL